MGRVNALLAKPDAERKIFSMLGILSLFLGNAFCKPGDFSVFAVDEVLKEIIAAAKRRRNQLRGFRGRITKVDHTYPLVPATKGNVV